MHGRIMVGARELCFRVSRNGEPFGETVQEVVSYADDVYVWVYLDQVDRVVRYEAYVVGYDEKGEQTTLDFVLEEGVLDNMHEVPLFNELLRELRERHPVAPNRPGSECRFTADGRLVTQDSLRYFYCALKPEQLEAVHRYFAAQESALKEAREKRWTRMLRALGYDVIPSL